MAFVGWDGRQLTAMVDMPANTYYYYTYNADGLRTSKINTTTGKETRYYYDGSQLVMQITGTQAQLNTYFSTGGGGCDVLWFKYDQTGIIGFTRSQARGVEEWYYYRKNVQGDVTGIYNNLGTLVACYEYDAWGKLLGTYSGTGAPRDSINYPGSICNVNPIRYRGYYYDDLGGNRGLYYLNSRYYDPNTMRFINADGQFNDDEHVLGANLYAYCCNDPVNAYDPDGNKRIAIVVGLGGSADRAFEVAAQTYKAEHPLDLCTIIYAKDYTKRSNPLTSLMAAIPENLDSFVYFGHAYVHGLSVFFGASFDERWIKAPHFLNISFKKSATVYLYGCDTSIAAKWISQLRPGVLAFGYSGAAYFTDDFRLGKGKRLGLASDDSKAKFSGRYLWLYSSSPMKVYWDGRQLS